MFLESILLFQTRTYLLCTEILYFLVYRRQIYNFKDMYNVV